uniref:Coiled coil domain-containing protein n=1 Tax=Desulfobacca acetoxidans TaxID=60893 RepID=A0A7V6DPW6_9BACT
MSLPEAYREQVEAKLKVWSAQIKELKAKAELAKAETKVELQKQIQSLQAKQEAVRTKLKELQGAGAAAWEKAKPELEQALEHLKNAWDNVKKTFS